MLNENWHDEISTSPLSELTEKSHSFIAVHSRSKKIRKSSNARTNSSKDQSPRYRTFTNTDKRTIIADLKKFVSRLEDCEQNVADEDFLEILKSVQRKEINTFLKSCLPNYIEEFDETTENLRIWRRRIKDWVKNFNQPETRGSLLVPHEKLDVFKNHLIQALRGLGCRSLKLLRPKIFDIFELIGRPVKNRTTCSKHWWYDFMKANLDVKEHWDALPKRQSKTDLKGSEESESEEEEEKMEEIVSSHHSVSKKTESRKVSLEEEEEENHQVFQRMGEINFNELCLAPVETKEEEKWSNEENSSGLSPHRDDEYSDEFFRRLLAEPRIDAYINRNALEDDS